MNKLQERRGNYLAMGDCEYWSTAMMRICCSSIVEPLPPIDHCACQWEWAGYASGGDSVRPRRAASPSLLQRYDGFSQGDAHSPARKPTRPLRRALGQGMFLRYDDFFAGSRARWPCLFAGDQYRRLLIAEASLLNAGYVTVGSDMGATSGRRSLHDNGGLRYMPSGQCLWLRPQLNAVWRRQIVDFSACCCSQKRVLYFEASC